MYALYRFFVKNRVYLNYENSHPKKQNFIQDKKNIDRGDYPGDIIRRAKVILYRYSFSSEGVSGFSISLSDGRRALAIGLEAAAEMQGGPFFTKAEIM